MQLESVVLELMARIQVLEKEVENLKEKISIVGFDVEQEENQKKNIKMTDEMIDLCYFYGKKAYFSPDTDIKTLAQSIAQQTGMNPNSAFMYIYVIKNMLEGVVFKRAINSKAIVKYFDNILSEYGKSGLNKAIKATKGHAMYRKKFGHPVDSIIAICDEYDKK